MSASPVSITPAPTKLFPLRQWVEEVVELTQPDQVHWCNGSEEEWHTLTKALVARGVAGGPPPAP